MKESRPKIKLDASLLPSPTGYREKKSTLCVGLDIAWFGGSKSDPSSRYDFLAAALLDSELKVEKVEVRRINLDQHDLKAEKTFAGLNALLKDIGVKADRIVLAVDAPLQAVSRGLPAREPKLVKGAVKRRACETYLNRRRKSIDKACGGANGWHPNIQSGAPVAPRVECLLRRLSNSFKLWTEERSNTPKLIIECFPAEAIWASKRMGYYPGSFTSARVKDYKAQAGCKLRASQVRSLVEDAVLDAFQYSTQTPQEWFSLVGEVTAWMLSDVTWMDSGLYDGGKLLDDVVDSTLCLATAICYALGRAHAWQDPENPEDGHIIGPGLMQELLTGRTRLV